MPFTIEARADYLEVRVNRRASPEEAAAIGKSVLAAQAQSGLRKILVVARESAPIFRVQQYGLSEMLKQAGAVEGLRVALVSDTVELRASHEYVGVLAKQRGIEVRSFHDEAKALKWLLGASEPQ